MKEKILQSIADLIISKLSKTSDDNMFDFYLDLGFWFDGVCVNYFDIYLK